VCFEGYHYRYHPFWYAAREALAEIGEVERVSATFDITLPDTSNIRYNYGLGGGALMDLGCYPLHILRTLLGTEPSVVDATHRPGPDPRIDEALSARLRFGDVEATVSCSLLEDEEVQRVEFTGADGTLVLDGFVKPHEGNQISVDARGQQRRFEVPTELTSYDAQLAVFVAAVREGAPIETGPDDSVQMMELIDAIYEAAGLPLRGA
jgi:predicted dehydrogenase